MAKKNSGLDKFGIPPEAMRYATVGVEFTVIFGFFVGLGILADRRWTGGWIFTVVGAMAGFLAGMYRLVKVGREYMKEFAPPPPAPKMPPRDDEAPDDMPRPEPKGRLAATMRYKAPPGAAEPMRIGPMLLVALAAITAAVLIGMLPTYLAAGWPGVLASAVAGALTWLVLAVNGAIVGRVAGRNPQTVGQLFFGLAVFRMGLSLGAAVGLGMALDLHMTALLVWVAIAYLPLLATETAWIARNVLRSSVNVLKNP
jgi:hypothetical protein